VYRLPRSGVESSRDVLEHAALIIVGSAPCPFPPDLTLCPLLPVQVLVRAGVDVAAPESRNRPTLIGSASTDAELCRWLISVGANVNAVDSYGLTPLLAARDASIIHALLEAGRSPSPDFPGPMPRDTAGVSVW